jgi:hypothetical protein
LATQVGLGWKVVEQSLVWVAQSVVQVVVGAVQLQMVVA